MDFLANKKTYLVALATLVYALSGSFLGHIDGPHAIELILAAAAMAGLRAGISKAQL